MARKGAKIGKLMQSWMDQEQGKHFCQCGCNEPIIITRDHHCKGIPNYKPHHYKKPSKRAGWIKENQGKHFCQCGCGEEIVIKKGHHHEGIPNYKVGHCNREEGSGNWKGGRYENDGYIYILNPDRDESKGIWRYIAEHRVIAAKVLGRKLEYHEHVHHINHNRSDNRNSNLLIIDVANHKELHWREETNKYNGTSAAVTARIEAMNCFLGGLSRLIVMTPF